MIFGTKSVRCTFQFINIVLHDTRLKNNEGCIQTMGSIHPLLIFPAEKINLTS